LENLKWDNSDKPINAVGAWVIKMPAIEIGRICVKVKSRESGRKCVIIDLIDENFVVVTGPKNLTGVRRRKANVNHIESTDKKIEIERGASDEAVAKALEEAGIIDFMKEPVKIEKKLI